MVLLPYPFLEYIPPQRFFTVEQLVAIAGLDDALDSGTWTVFAPTNEAFDMLGDDVISSLENNTGTYVSFCFLANGEP